MPYITISELRDEGFEASEFSDEQLEVAILMSEKFIEKATQNFFEKRDLTLKLNGNDSELLLLPCSIIEINSVKIVIDNTLQFQYDLEYIRIFNRRYPDDRNYPKIAFIQTNDLDFSGVQDEIIKENTQGFRFPHGYQNIWIEGSFGYVDIENNSSYDPLLPEDPVTNPKYLYLTPTLIKYATKKLVKEYIIKVNDETGQENKKRKYIKSEKTDGHEYELDTSGTSGSNATNSGFIYSGDPEVDRILEMFARNAQTIEFGYV